MTAAARKQRPQLAEQPAAAVIDDPQKLALLVKLQAVADAAPIIEGEALRRNFHAYVKATWHIVMPGYEFKDNWHIQHICKCLEAVTKGEIKRLLINIPPRHIKSTLVTVLWPTWDWLHNPSRQFLTASYSKDLATRDAVLSRRLMESDWYRLRFGHKFQFTSDQNVKTRYENDKRGYRVITSTDSGATGEGGDVLIADDMISAKQAYSQAACQSAITWWKETMSTRYNDPNNSAAVVVGQRLGEHDPYNYLIEQGGWDRLSLPMRYEPKKIVPMPLGLKDPRKKSGELIHPARFNEAAVKQLEKELGEYGAPAQLQQDPQPLGGGLFKDKFWGYYSDEQLPTKFYAMLVYSDTAQKTKEHNDRSAFVFVGLSKLGKEKYLYILDVNCDRFEADDLLAQAIKFWTKHKHQGKVQGATLFKVEDKSSGTGLIQQLMKRIGPNRVKGIPRSTDKLSRAMGCIAEFADHRILLPKGPTRYSDAQWVDDYKKEFAAFSPLMTHAHDDQIDPTLDAVEDLLINDAYNMYANL